MKRMPSSSRYSLTLLEVAVRRGDDAALAHDGLGDEGADLAREVQAGDLGDAPRAEQAALVGRGLGEAAVAVGRRDEGDARHVGAAALLAARVAGDREGGERTAVEARLDGEELTPAAVALGEAEGALDGLGAAVAEEALLQPARRDLGELLGQGADAGDVIDVRAGVDELVGLRLGGVEHLGVVVTGVGDADAGEAVDVLRAVGVVEQRPVAVIRDHRLDALHEPGHDVVAILFLHTHAIDHPSAYGYERDKRGAAEGYQMGPPGLPGVRRAGRTKCRPSLGRPGHLALPPQSTARACHDRGADYYGPAG